MAKIINRMKTEIQSVLNVVKSSIVLMNTIGQSKKKKKGKGGKVLFIHKSCYEKYLPTHTHTHNERK